MNIHDTFQILFKVDHYIVGGQNLDRAIGVGFIAFIGKKNDLFAIKLCELWVLLKQYTICNNERQLWIYCSIIGIIGF